MVEFCDYPWGQPNDYGINSITGVIRQRVGNIEVFVIIWEAVRIVTCSTRGKC